MNWHVYKAMINYLENVMCFPKEVIKRNGNHPSADWFSAKEWSNYTQTTITGQRLTSMYNAGLVNRRKKQNGIYEYYPIIK